MIANKIIFIELCKTTTGVILLTQNFLPFFLIYFLMQSSLDSDSCNTDTVSNKSLHPHLYRKELFRHCCLRCLQQYQGSPKGCLPPWGSFCYDLFSFSFKLPCSSCYVHKEQESLCKSKLHVQVTVLSQGSFSSTLLVEKTHEHF